MTLHQNLLEKRSQLYWLRFELKIYRLQAICAIHYAMKYLVKIIVDVVNRFTGKPLHMEEIESFGGWAKPPTRRRGRWAQTSTLDRYF